MVQSVEQTLNVSYPSSDMRCAKETGHNKILRPSDAKPSPSRRALKPGVHGGAGAAGADATPLPSREKGTETSNSSSRGPTEHVDATPFPMRRD